MFKVISKVSVKVKLFFSMLACTLHPVLSFEFRQNVFFFCCPTCWLAFSFLLSFLGAGWVPSLIHTFDAKIVFEMTMECSWRFVKIEREENQNSLFRSQQNFDKFLYSWIRSFSVRIFVYYRLISNFFYSADFGSIYI